MTSNLRTPLRNTTRHNNILGQSPSGKSANSDLDQLALELRINELPNRNDVFRSKFETNSAIISAFKNPNNRQSSLIRDVQTQSRTHVEIEVQNEKDLLVSPGYEYLCRVQAIKDWLEKVLQTKIAESASDLLTYIRNGIYLAKLANKFLPTKRSIFTNDTKLDFRHTENINSFFRLLHHLEFPSLFFFELTDLFDGKDIPKVWYCLHALSYRINAISSDCPLIENLVGSIEFSTSEIAKANRQLAGRHLPGFSSIDTNSFNSPAKSGFVNKALNLSSPGKAFRDVHVNKATRENTTPYSLRTSTKINLELKESPPLTFVSLEGSPRSRKTNKIQENNHVANLQANDVIRLQTLARGSLARYKMFVDRIMLRSFESELQEFLSITRGYLVRSKSVHGNRREVKIFERDIIKFQSLCKGILLRTEAYLTDKDDQLSYLKAIARGQKVRRTHAELLDSINLRKGSVIELQSVVRRIKVQRIISIVIENKSTLFPLVISIQSQIRGFSSRKLGNSSIVKCNEIESFRGFQAIVKGALARNRVRLILRQFFQSTTMVVEFQSVIRGAISRTKLCNGVLVSLIEEDLPMNRLYAKAKTNMVASRVKEVHLSLLQSKNKIITLQSAFRGILLRFNLEVQVETIYENIDSIISLQSVVRSKSPGRLLNEFKQYYQSNLAKVVVAQAFIRRFIAQSAYKSLLNTRNPPLSVIKKFGNLLVDQTNDLAEESCLSQLKDTIMDLSRSNEELELQIDHLDIKLSLLDKNMITADEFVKQRTKFVSPKQGYKSVNSTQKSNLLSRSAKRRLDIYLSIFYILQTNSSYSTKYLAFLRFQDKREVSKFIDLLMSLYPCKLSDEKVHTREEFFLVKFLFALIRNDYLQVVSNIADITKAKQCIWIRLFSTFNNSSQNRKTLLSIFGRTLKALWSEELISFESDPSLIYEQIRMKEIKTHGTSLRKENISASDAIADKDVSDTFVKNLISLRDYTVEIITVLNVNIASLPIHVRLVAKEAYVLSRNQFPEHLDGMHLSVAGVIVIKHYVSGILHSPELFGFQGASKAGGAGSSSLKNFSFLSKVLLQIFSMKPFRDNFMKPLNDFVMSYTDEIKQMIRGIIDVKDPEAEYEINEFDDLVLSNKPTVTMKLRDMIDLERIILDNLHVFAPNVDDPLRELVSRLNENFSSTEDLIQLADLGVYTLSLTPASNVDTIEQSKKRMLISKAKIYILYLINIQLGNDLLELLIQGITQEHELAFKRMVRSQCEIGSTKSHVGQDYAHHEQLLSISFAELKQNLLKLLLELENLGEIQRSNSYQGIINQLVLDIKTKGQKRDFRKNQLSLSGETVQRLKKKKEVLEKQLNDYNQHIDHMLETLQLKPKEKKILNIIPVFSKQYFYHRQLRKNNCLPKFGSYIHSSKKLIDQGVILEVEKTFARKSPNSSKLEFKFSCHLIGVFTIEAAISSVNIPGACNIINLDDILDRQQEKLKVWPLFEKKVTFDTDALAALIFKQFYEVNIK